MELAERLERDGYESFREPALAGERGDDGRRVDDHARRRHRRALDTSTVRKQFPILARDHRRRPDRLPRLGEHVAEAAGGHRRDDRRSPRPSYAPINRSAYRLAAEATDAYEGARAKVARFVNAPAADEIVFTKNATEALNLVAQAWGRANLGAGDVVVLTHMEHHANIVPWHMLAAERGIEIRWIPLTPDGHLDLGDLDRLLDGAKVLSFTRDEQRARHAATRSPSSPPPPTTPAPSPSSTPASTCPTTSPTCRRGTPTSPPSPATRCAVRRASACCGAGPNCSTPCRRSSAAAT